jgi:hypothetical protein
MAAAIFDGSIGLSWGLTSAETGILAQSYERAVSGSEKLAKNNAGETVGVSYYDAIADHTIEGYYAGTTGIAAAAFGTALVIANVLSGNGVAAGIVICNSVTDKLANEDFRSFNATCRQFPLITAA